MLLPWCAVMHMYTARVIVLHRLTRRLSAPLLAAVLSGKTASFCIPVLEKVDVSIPRTQALILVPTRELALQTSSVLKKLGKHLAGLTVIVSTGGTDLKEDIIRLMKPCHVIVATPGRILDLANKSVADLSSCGMFVMDEADKLLSPEFVPLIDKLLSFTPDSRQVLCFSATFPRTVVSFRDRWCQDAHEINLMEELTLKGVTQYYAFVDERQKVHCFPESDTRVLTNHGLLFVDEIEALLAERKEVLYACYELTKAVNVEVMGIVQEVMVESKELVYSKGELVFGPSPTHLVEFTSPGEAERLVQGSGPQGKDDMPDDFERSHHISLRVTPDHDMFVEEEVSEDANGSPCWSDSSSRASGRRSVTFTPHRKVRADALLRPACSCPHNQTGTLACVHRRAHVRMLACAESGYVPMASATRREAVQRALRLDETQFIVFLEVLGFWLGDGGVSSNHLGNGCVWFDRVKQAEQAWLKEMLPKVGLQLSSLSWTFNLNGDGARLSIGVPAWLAWFHAEFGAQCSGSQHHIAATSNVAAGISPPSYTRSLPSESVSITSVNSDLTDSSFNDSDNDDDEEDKAASETIKSDKCMPDWMLAELSRDETQRLIMGLHRADSSFASGVNEICTCSARLRDQLMHALLHCGYSPHSDLKHAAGTIRGYRFHKQSADSSTYSVSFVSDLSPTERLEYIPIIADVDQWEVNWADVGHASTSPGRASCWPSMLRQNCITRVPYSRERDGRVWCVNVHHSDHLLIAQRAQRDNDTRVVTKQSRPIVVGNCLNTLFAKLDINQVRHTTPAPHSHTLHARSLLQLGAWHVSAAQWHSPLSVISLCCPLPVSVHHLLQQCDPSGALGQKDH